MRKSRRLSDSYEQLGIGTVKYWQWDLIRPLSPSAISRRRDVRMEAPKTLTLTIAGGHGRSIVKDISSRGVCVSADVAFALGSIHGMTIALGRMTATRRARTIHCHRHPTEGWIVGLEFIEDPARPGDATIDELMDEVAASDVTFY